MLICNQERRHGTATGELAGGREVEGDDLQHLQLRLRPEGKGWRGGRQVITFSQDLIQSIGCFCAQILMNFA